MISQTGVTIIIYDDNDIYTNLSPVRWFKLNRIRMVPTSNLSRIIEYTNKLSMTFLSIARRHLSQTKTWTLHYRSPSSHSSLVFLTLNDVSYSLKYWQPLSCTFITAAKVHRIFQRFHSETKRGVYDCKS